MSASKITKYIEKLHEKLQKEQHNYFYVFRGQPNGQWALNCSASRKFDESEKDDRNLLEDNQNKLISDLKIRGFGLTKDKRTLKDLEFLADLRHYGIPSCLIDFTSNFLVALWFACEDDVNNNGKIFILNCYETDKFLKVSSETIDKNIAFFFEKDDWLWYWVPERLNQRLIDQDAVFVFGQPTITKYESIVINKNDKKDILDELEKFFDYTKKHYFQTNTLLVKFTKTLVKKKAVKAISNTV